MRKMHQVLLVVLTILSTGQSFALTYAEPSAFDVVETWADNRFIRIDNARRVVEIRKSDTFELAWEVSIKSYRFYGSIVHLSLDGKYLFHIVPNTFVLSLDSTIVEIYSADGLVTSYKASEVTDSLSEAREPRIGGAARFYWHGGSCYIRPGPQDLSVKLTDGGMVSLWADKHRVIIYPKPE